MAIIAEADKPWPYSVAMEQAMLEFKQRVATLAQRTRVVIPPGELVPAAVLVPLVFRGVQPHLILTKRTMSVATHKGQISFPGGQREAVDANLVETALRETREEIGIDPSLIDVSALLDDRRTITRFIITPVVGFVSPSAEMKPDPAEVAEIIEAPLNALSNPRCHELVSIEIGGARHTYHQYNVDGHRIWGATAGIIHDLLTLLQQEELRT